MSAQRPPLPPLPTRMATPDAPDFATFTFSSQIGHRPSLLDRMGHGPRLSFGSLAQHTTSQMQQAKSIPQSTSTCHEKFTVEPVSSVTPAEETDLHQSQSFPPPLAVTSEQPTMEVDPERTINIPNDWLHKSPPPLNRLALDDIWRDTSLVQAEWAAVERPASSPPVMNIVLSPNEVPLGVPSSTWQEHAVKIPVGGSVFKPGQPVSKTSQAISDANISRERQTNVTAKTGEATITQKEAAIKSKAGESSNPPIQHESIPFISSQNEVDTIAQGQAVAGSTGQVAQAREVKVSETGSNSRHQMNREKFKGPDSTRDEEVYSAPTDYQATNTNANAATVSATRRTQDGPLRTQLPALQHTSSNEQAVIHTSHDAFNQSLASHISHAPPSSTPSLSVNQKMSDTSQASESQSSAPFSNYRSVVHREATNVQPTKDYTGNRDSYSQATIKQGHMSRRGPDRTYSNLSPPLRLRSISPQQRPREYEAKGRRMPHTPPYTRSRSPPSLQRLYYRRMPSPPPRSPPSMQRSYYRRTPSPPPRSPPSMQRSYYRRTPSPPPRSPPSLQRSYSRNIPPSPPRSPLSRGCLRFPPPDLSSERPHIHAPPRSRNTTEVRYRTSSPPILAPHAKHLAYERQDISDSRMSSPMGERRNLPSHSSQRRPIDAASIPAPWGTNKTQSPRRFMEDRPLHLQDQTVQRPRSNSQIGTEVAYRRESALTQKLNKPSLPQPPAASMDRTHLLASPRGIKRPIDEEELSGTSRSSQDPSLIEGPVTKRRRVEQGRQVVEASTRLRPQEFQLSAVSQSPNAIETSYLRLNKPRSVTPPLVSGASTNDGSNYVPLLMRMAGNSLPPILSSHPTGAEPRVHQANESTNQASLLKRFNIPAEQRISAPTASAHGETSRTRSGETSEPLTLNGDTITTTSSSSGIPLSERLDQALPRGIQLARSISAQSKARPGPGTSVPLKDRLQNAPNGSKSLSNGGQPPTAPLSSRVAPTNPLVSESRRSNGPEGTSHQHVGHLSNSTQLQRQKGKDNPVSILDETGRSLLDRLD